jgi:thymidylate kinase
MFTVALVGCDGAGKTTIAKGLGESLPLPTKYLYMGMSPISSNVALPTTRLAGFLRVQAYRKEAGRSGVTPRKEVSTHDLHYRSVKRSPIWVAARTLNRLADIIYRVIISWWYRRQGYVVVYDRHPAFETARLASDWEALGWKHHARIQHWLLSTICPRPDLAIYLDAPAEVLYARKKEATPEYLERRRRVIMEQGATMDSFLRVDATQPPDRVLAEVTRLVTEFHTSDFEKTRGISARRVAK